MPDKCPLTMWLEQSFFPLPFTFSPIKEILNILAMNGNDPRHLFLLVEEVQEVVYYFIFSNVIRVDGTSASNYVAFFQNKFY